MKTILMCFAFLVMSWCIATTIDPEHPYAYGANIGWLNAQGDDIHGAVIGCAYCTGSIWSANCGWIGLGNTPANGWQYTNTAVHDWGVNHDGQGNLSGYAYGANIGWIAFEQNVGKPRVDLLTGNLSGYVWGANIGWITLTNAQAYVRTATLAPGPDSDGDGIPDAYEYARAGDLTTLSDHGADADEDGVSDVDEAAADTGATDKDDRFEIVAFTSGTGTNTLAWTSRPTRLYRVEATNTLPSTADGEWTDVGGGLLGPPEGSPSMKGIATGDETRRFYRIQVVTPLAQ